MAEQGAEYPPFNWGITVAQIEENSGRIVAETRALLDEIAALPAAELTFENCVEPLMRPPNYKTNARLCEAKFLQHCSPEAPVREAAAAAGVRFSKERVAMRMHAGVYRSLKSFAAQEEKVAALPPYRRHFLDALLADYRRGGLELAEEERARLQALLNEDTGLCSDFGANITNDDTRLRFSRAQLEGLPEPFLQKRVVADADAAEGEIEISLKYPDTVPIMSNCQVAETRRRVQQAVGTAFGNNLELMQKAAGKRQELAQLLGYDHFADYVCSRRMAGSAEAVMEFLTSLHAKLVPTARKEKQRLLELKRSHVEGRGEEFDGKLNAWDLSFYNNLLLKQQYGVDQQKIKQYFPIDVVVNGTLEIYQELLGLRFTELSGFSTWHEDVRLFVVHDAQTGAQMGHFYLDMHPRDGKYNHAAIFHLLKAWGPQRPVDCMLANLPAKVGDRPALLKHDDVVTFFHEFGHIMHGLCAEGDGNSTHLAKCPRDFVEAPSQMLENWCWSSEVLGRLSQHWETGESLSKEDLESLIKAKNVNVALFSCRQIYLSIMDMRIHMDAPDDLQKLNDELRLELSLFENPEGTSMLRSFGHLMNQYAAGYYGYLWSQVLSEDMFCSRFKKEGLANKQTGMDYRKQVLAVGGVGSILEHVTRFLGKKPSQEHFLASKGITP